MRRGVGNFSLADGGRGGYEAQMGAADDVKSAAPPLTPAERVNL